MYIDMLQEPMEERVARDKTPEHSNGNTMQLCNAPIGVPLEVVGIAGGHRIRMRLLSLGIHPGETVTIVRRNPGGPLLIEVKGGRVGLGRGIATAVSVKTR